MLALLLSAHAACMDPVGNPVDVSSDQIRIGKNKDAVSGETAEKLENDWIRATYGLDASDLFLEWRQHEKTQNQLRHTVWLSVLNPVQLTMELAMIEANRQTILEDQEHLETLLCLGPGPEAPEIASLPEAK